MGISDEDVDLLVAALPAVLSAPLGVDAGGIALADLAPEDRLDELGFDLSVARGQAYQRGAPVVLGRSLGAALGAPREDPPWPASYGLALRAGVAAFPDLAGFLTGSIDLVYRVRRGRSHRYYLADYKTNWLGEARLGSRPARSTVAHYERKALAGEMVKHHYFVQGQLYLLALHRYLRLRLGARYDYDEHLGGTVYLFLRGMSAAPAPGPTPGVFFDRPPRAVIEALDAVLGAVPS